MKREKSAPEMNNIALLNIELIKFCRNMLRRKVF